jgi:hypothetical protein
MPAVTLGRREHRFPAWRVEIGNVDNAEHIERPEAQRRRGRVRRRGARRRATTALGALIALALPTGALAGTEIAEEPHLSTTGNDSELVKAIPIATEQYVDERVAMSLGPEELPRIENGDRLRASGEVQVSTTCVYRGPRCVGRRYDFNPWITARLVLVAAPGATAGGLALSEAVRVRCKQLRPNRNHHCTLVLPNLDTTVVDTASLPCPENACYVNLIVGAWSKQAQRGNRVVLGGDLPDGGIIQDKGRLNVVIEPSGAPPPIESTSAVLVNDSVPVTEVQKKTRRVIHSVEIPAARKGDVLAFDASYLATIDHLPFNTFIGNRVIVTDSPVSTKPSGLAKRVALFGGQATETNGFNCTQGKSGYPSPCTVVKAGATRITRDAVDDQGQPVPLYVNLVAAAAPKLTVELKRDQVVNVSPTNGLRVLRLPAG